MLFALSPTRAEATWNNKRVSAPVYMDRLFEWIWGKIENPKEFPHYTGICCFSKALPTHSPDQPFPEKFGETIAEIYRRLARVWTHLYLCHKNAIDRMSCLSYVFGDFVALRLETELFSILIFRYLFTLFHLFRRQIACQ